MSCVCRSKKPPPSAGLGTIGTSWWNYWASWETSSRGGEGQHLQDNRKSKGGWRFNFQTPVLGTTSSDNTLLFQYFMGGLSSLLLFYIKAKVVHFKIFHSSQFYQQLIHLNHIFTLVWVVRHLNSRLQWTLCKRLSLSLLTYPSFSSTCKKKKKKWRLVERSESSVMVIDGSILLVLWVDEDKASSAPHICSALPSRILISHSSSRTRCCD